MLDNGATEIKVMVTSTQSYLVYLRILRNRVMPFLVIAILGVCTALYGHKKEE